ncbi:DUF3263 domain-containing protein [Streptomyces sp. NPDC058525]|uniref:DUF3263 domain-containing protein n=1 Tax=Streptomyces sp. NPDC058525 TaxID=3346538 RepID=UPI0036498F5F
MATFGKSSAWRPRSTSSSSTHLDDPAAWAAYPAIVKRLRDRRQRNRDLHW